MRAAEQIAAQLGGAAAPGASESQVQFAQRLLGNLRPPAPTRPKRSAAEVVADHVCGTRSHQTETPEDPNSAASRVADYVVATKGQ